MALSSLRRTLLSMLIPAALLTSGVSLTLSSIELKEQVNAAFDRALAGALKSMEANVRTISGGLAMEQSYYMMEYMEYTIRGHMYFRVATEDGLSEIGFTGMPLPPDGLSSNRPVFYNADYLGEPLRIATVALESGERLQTYQDSRILIQAGENVSGRNEFIRNVLIQNLLQDLAVLGVFMLLILAGTLLALRPLRKISADVRHRSYDNLEPIDQRSLPREVRPLVQTINLHLDRYARKSREQQQFLDDASHQLKTPLAVLLTQVDYAQTLAQSDEMQEVLQAIQQRLNNTVQMTHQMVALSRVRDVAEQLRVKAARGSVDLCRVAAEVMDELWGLARSRRQDLGLEAPDHPVRVSGVAWLLQQALSNVLSNAIKYCPPQACITVSVYQNGRVCVLRVDDDGPGMSPDDLAKAGHRFRRGQAGKAMQGSGLGLAIVQAIAQIHDARLSLQPGPDGQGLTVLLEFDALP
ncbi:MAG TPA: sensor histidine kinase N-terminal domain-containing protein [Alcaligenes sp.]|nr:sensor histidine kinase N-terminal domain-containing protein [Alcaligenes sp.]